MLHHGFLWLIAFLGLATLMIIFAVANVGVVPIWLTATIIVALLGVGGGVLASILRVSRLRPDPSGYSRFLGHNATVIVTLSPVGRVKLHGENWAARLEDVYADTTLPIGSNVRVVSIQNLVLIVEPFPDLTTMIPQSTTRADAQA